MAELRKYNVETKVLFPVVDFGATDFESTPVVHAVGDTQISKDEGNFGNTANAFVHEGNGIYSITLTLTEMQAARIVLTVIDQTNPKEWEDQAILIDTYGNASAQHAMNFDEAVQTVIENNNLDHLLKVPVMPADVVDDTVIAVMVSSAEFDQWIAYNGYEDSLQGISERQWASDERSNIRYQLGVNGTQIAPSSNIPNLATGSEVGAVKSIVDKLDTAMEADGVVYRFTDNALEQGVAGGFGATDRDKLDTLILYAKEN